MKHLLLCLLAASTGCGGGAGDGGQPPDAAAPVLGYQTFTTRTRSMSKDQDFQISTTDVMGPIACALPADQSAGIGTSGSQIILAFHDPNFQNCPVGTYAIRSGCQQPATGGFSMQVPDGCAYYRRYDQQGHLLGTLPATAGAISVTGTESACTFMVNLSFSGQTHADTFTLTSWPMSWPWCK